jgi:hypothetical protein
MKLTPELRAFKYYKKNINYYLNQMSFWWGDDKKQEEMYQEIASKFGADYKKFMEINCISYERSVERAFRCF